jgi:hypothetical protein
VAVLGHHDWMRAVSSDGSTVVEVVRLTCTNGRDGEWIRVRRHGFYVGSVRTVGELAGLGVDLANWARPSYQLLCVIGGGKIAETRR